MFQIKWNCKILSLSNAKNLLSWKKYNLASHPLAKKKKKKMPGLDFIQEDICLPGTNNSTTLIMCQTSDFNKNALF